MPEKPVQRMQQKSFTDAIAPPVRVDSQSKQFTFRCTGSEKSVAANLIVFFSNKTDAVAGLYLFNEQLLTPGISHRSLLNVGHRGKIGYLQGSDDHTIRSATETVRSPSILV